MERYLFGLFYGSAVLAVLLLASLCRTAALRRKYNHIKRAFDLSVREEEAARRKEKLYAAMLPERLLELFQKKDTKEFLTREGRNIRAAVLSFNVEGFSQMARKRTAEEVFRFVNEVLEQAVPQVLFQEGAVERFADAGFRAFYLDTPGRALASAVSVCEAMDRAEHIHGNYSIGISYGDVMAGMVGHEERMGMLTISETTGIAEFLQELAGRYRARILISGSMRSQIPDFEKNYSSRYLGRIYLKAADLEEELYDVYDGDPPEDKNGKRRTRLMFEKGVELFQEQRYSDARLHFIEVLKANRMDRAAKEYLYLCGRYEDCGEEDASVYLEIY